MPSGQRPMGAGAVCLRKKQPVQFVDPMQSAYFGDDEDFEPDEL